MDPVTVDTSTPGCAHEHKSARQGRIGFGNDLPRLWLAVERTSAFEATYYSWDGEHPVTVEPGTHLRLDATDYSYAGPEFGPGIGWHRFCVLDGPMAGHCLAVTVDDPIPPPATLQPIDSSSG